MRGFADRDMCRVWGDNRTACIILLKESERKGQSESTKCSCGDNIKVDLEEVGWECVNWINMAQDRDKYAGFLNTVVGFGVP
jgi:hypothetical protein